MGCNRGLRIALVGGVIGLVGMLGGSPRTGGAAETPPAAVVAHIEQRWAGLQAAMRAGDVAQTLEFFAHGVRPRYGPLFTALGPSQLPEVGKGLGALHEVRVQEGRAIGRIQQGPPSGGQAAPVTHQVTFIQGPDGEWYVEEM